MDEERRRFLNSATKAAMVAPAATLLLSASTQMALPYGQPGSSGGGPGLGNPGNDKFVGNAGDKFGSPGDLGNSHHHDDDHDHDHDHDH